VRALFDSNRVLTLIGSAVGADLGVIAAHVPQIAVSPIPTRLRR